MKDVSIIIVSYNSLEQTTRPCLESIFHRTTDLDYEVIVVDNHPGRRQILGRPLTPAGRPRPSRP